MHLDVLQANDGDCLLLRYGNETRRRMVLIDGGSRGVYKSFLRPHLDDLRGDAEVLEIRLVIASHIDADHITGLVDFFRAMSEAKNSGKTPPFKVQSLWHNSFSSMAGRFGAIAESAAIGAALEGIAAPAGLTNEASAVIASISQGNKLNNFAETLTSRNAETGQKPVQAESGGKTVIRIDEMLTFTVIGPRQKELDDLEEQWGKAKEKQFNDEAAAADFLNRTIPNLSSIVVLAELNENGTKKRLLFTGDAGGDLILKGLESTGLLDANGGLHLDVLKVQHHGSNHSVDLNFFRRITADRYVISGNGKHGLPNSDTLGWLSAARERDRYDVYLTNRKGVDDLETRIDAFLKGESSNLGHHYCFRKEEACCITLDL